MTELPARRIVFLSAASFGVLGGCLTLPGTLLPLLVERFAIRLVEAGSMLAFQSIGYVVSVLVASQLIRRLGMRAVLGGALLTSGVGFAGFGLANGWLSGAAMMLVAGLGFGVMEVATNTLLITSGGERRSNVLNFAHLFFGGFALVDERLDVARMHGVGCGFADATATLARAEAETPRWFTRMPRVGCNAIAVGVGPMAFYTAPAPDGGRFATPRVLLSSNL
jgi:MFS family permease